MDIDSQTDTWADINTLRTPAYTEPSEDDVLALQEAIAEAADAMAWRISERARAHRAAGEEAPERVVLAGDYQLALLYSLRQAAAAVERRAAAAARTAGHQGAGYPQLGAAWGITRQSARAKWPHAVPSRAHLPQPPVPVQHAGGTAAVLHQPDTDDLWMFTALAADGSKRVSPAEYTSSAAAAHAARTFLADHTAL
ncbi:hypothetical protein [Streptomyces sp. NPDC001389]|uniref:hypothetical protein n=1 Tax=Streptomyces sp. NPDC001389 TaxID=3364569 RepID=UPI00368C54BC